MSAALQCLDDAKLVVGINPGKNPHLFDDGIQFGVVHAPKLGTGDESSARLEDGELARDRTRGCRVVAGDHHGSDMRMPRDSDGGLHLLPRRVDHADDPEQHEIVFDTVR